MIDGINPVDFIDPNGPDANDPTKLLAGFGIEEVDLQGQQSSRIIQRFVTGTRMVKAFKQLDVSDLPNPETAESARMLF